NGTCEPQCGETSVTCPGDCTAMCVCGNGVCQAACGETTASCPQDCPVPCVCGNGQCQALCGATQANCPPDCPQPCGCGNGQCQPQCMENSSTCPQDCGSGNCSHDKCTTGNALVSGCDPCVTQICAADPFCCMNSWDGICVGEVASVCGITCPPPCFC